MSERKEFSSKEKDIEVNQLITEVCKYRSMGERPCDIWPKVTVKCSRSQVEAISSKYDYVSYVMAELKAIFA